MFGNPDFNLNFHSNIELQFNTFLIKSFSSIYDDDADEVKCKHHLDAASQCIAEIEQIKRTARFSNEDLFHILCDLIDYEIYIRNSRGKLILVSPFDLKDYVKNTNRTFIIGNEIVEWSGKWK